MKLLFKKFNLIIILSLLVLPATFTQAATINPSISANQTERFRLVSGFAGSTGEQGLANIIATGIQVVLSLLGVLFTVLIIVSGFRWMTAGGNEEQIIKARKNITNAAIGLLVILMAYAITWFVFTQLPLTAGSPGGVM